MNKLFLVLLASLFLSNAEAAGTCISLVSVPKQTTNVSSHSCQFVYKERDQGGTERLQNYSTSESVFCDVCTYPPAVIFTLGIWAAVEVMDEWTEEKSEVADRCELNFQEKLAQACPDAVVVDGKSRIPVSEYYK